MKQKILIVEDDQSLSEAYDMILTSSGYDVIVARDGRQALEATSRIEPDLILLDLRMPRVGGIQFLRDYMRDKLHPSVKIIVFSNLDTQKDIDLVYKLGADKYILKAWASPNELVKLVKDILKQPS